MAFKYTKRADGRLMKRVSVNGKLETLYSYDVKDLERQYIEKKHLSHKGVFINDEGMTVGVWADKWVELYKSDKELATQKMYKNAIRLHIKPYIGNIPLKQLKQSDIINMLNELEKKNITRKKDIAFLVIKQILDAAIDNDYIYRNVSHGIKVKKHKSAEKRPVDNKVIIEMNKLAKNDFNAFMVFFLIYTGLRREEIVPLQYKDINIDEKYILINKAVHFEKNQPILKSTKNKETRRVPIFDILYYDLKSLKESHNDNEYVFPNTLNKMMSETCVKRKIAYVLRQLNEIDTLKSDNKIKFTLHELRHTYVCLLHKAGIDIKQAQIWTGHKDVKVLLNIYTHLDEEDNQNSIDKVNHFLA